MDAEGDIRPENLDSKLMFSSPSTHSEISTDGDASMSQPAMLGNDKGFSSADASKDMAFEPKTKKRRKQSNPLKCQSSQAVEVPVQELEMVGAGDQEFPPVPSSETKSNVETHTENSSSEKQNSGEQSSPENMSQKNILTQMNEMLYGNMARLNNSNSHQAAHKNKSSLHLLTEMASPDSSEDVSRSIENKTAFPSFYPQMPPLLPINPTDFAGELSKFSNVFSQLTELPTQLMQTSLSMTSSNRSFITSNGVRVFNPEAYCELCEKEFCNKYFLKTHKANKHGVCSVDNSSFLYRAPYKNTLASSTSQVMNQVSENSSHSTADAYCNICQKSFCNKYFLKKHRQNIHGIVENGTESSNTPSSIHVPVISSIPSLRLPDAKSDGTHLEQTLSNLKANLNGNSPLASLNGLNALGKGKLFSSGKSGRDLKSERFLCELCNIEFCDKHYLNAHRQNKHAADVSLKANLDHFEFSEAGKAEIAEMSNKAGGRPEEFKSQMCIPCMKNFTSTESFHNHMLEVHTTTVKEENSGKKDQICSEKNLSTELALQLLKKSSSSPENENSNSSTDSGALYCSLCYMKFKDKTALLLHFESSHNVGESLSHVNGSLDTKEALQLQCDACPERFPDKHTLMSHRLKAHGIISPMAEPHNTNTNTDTDTLKGIEADYSSMSSNKHGVASQNFCRICNKELCNKYFMKTHMLKMHGIDLEALHIDRTSKSDKNVTCDVCHKVLSSKSFLKVHRLNVHGLTEDMKSNVLPETLPDPSALDSLGKKISDVTSNNFPQANETTNGSLKEEMKAYIFSCEICSQEFPSKLLLQLHLVNKHVNNNEPKVTNLGGLIGLSIAKPESFGKAFVKENENEPVASEKMCTCCTPITKEGKLVPFGVATENSLFHCHICNVPYHPKNHYQHHLTHLELMVRETKPSVKSTGKHFVDEAQNVNNSDVQNVDADRIFLDDGGRNKLRSRKFKRFRCSKCDKTFRTRNKCLHHIQVAHKNKKQLISHLEQQAVNDHSPPKNQFPDCNPKIGADKVGVAHNDSISEGNGKKSWHQADEYQPSCLPVPYVLPKNSQDVIMQPFHMTEPKTDGLSKPDVFVPSLVYLPVSKKVSEPITVAFTLTPA